MHQEHREPMQTSDHVHREHREHMQWLLLTADMASSNSLAPSSTVQELGAPKVKTLSPFAHTFVQSHTRHCWSGPLTTRVNAPE